LKWCFPAVVCSSNTGSTNGAAASEFCHPLETAPIWSNIRAAVTQTIDSSTPLQQEVRIALSSHCSLCTRRRMWQVLNSRNHLPFWGTNNGALQSLGSLSKPSPNSGLPQKTSSNSSTSKPTSESPRQTSTTHLLFRVNWNSTRSTCERSPPHL
jgi:hypothetical protein